MDIFNPSTRKIVCVKNNHNFYGTTDTHHFLEVGKQYTLCNIDVGSFYSVVTLKEFPNTRFNSVLFEELS